MKFLKQVIIIPLYRVFAASVDGEFHTGWREILEFCWGFFLMVMFLLLVAKAWVKIREAWEKRQKRKRKKTHLE